MKDKEVPLEVRVNINNAKDVEVGLLFGANSVGLCRTENMLCKPEALREIRKVVLLDKEEDYKKHMLGLLPQASNRFAQDYNNHIILEKIMIPSFLSLFPFQQTDR